MKVETGIENAPSAFPPTRWPLIRAIQDGHAEALNHFARLYWRPTFCFLRARGCSTHEAEELAQEFFLKLLQGGWIQRADSERGTFRVFLRMHLRSFLADRTNPDRIRRQLRFERQLASLEGIGRGLGQIFEPASGASPDEAFDHAFAKSVIETVRNRLYANGSKEHPLDWNGIFSAAYPEDCLTEPMSQQAIASKFGCSRDQVRVILTRMKRLFLDLLHAEMKGYAGDDADLAAEEAELLALLSQPHPWGHDD